MNHTCGRTRGRMRRTRATPCLLTACVDDEATRSAPCGAAQAPPLAAVCAAWAAAWAVWAARRHAGRLQRGRRVLRRRRLRRDSGVVCASEDRKRAGVNARSQSMGQWRAGVRAARRRLGCEARARGSPAQGPPCMVRMVDGLFEDCARAKRLAPRLWRRRAPQKRPLAHGLCARRADAQTSAKSAGAGLRRAAAHRRAQAPTDARRARRQRC